jgi:hypothetical protein
MFLESRIEEAELKIKESKEELKMAKQIRKHRQGMLTPKSLYHS